MAATTGQCTAPCRWCSRADEMAVNTIVAVDVATAMWTTCSIGKRRCVNRMVRIGTMMTPAITRGLALTADANTPNRTGCGMGQDGPSMRSTERPS